MVADFLKAKIRAGSRLSVVSAYFTIYAYEALKDHLDQIDHLDFLFGEPRFIASLDPDRTEKKAFILDGHGLQLAKPGGKAAENAGEAPAAAESGKNPRPPQNKGATSERTFMRLFRSGPNGGLADAYSHVPRQASCLT
jgi:hypothetical protein